MPKLKQACHSSFTIIFSHGGTLALLKHNVYRTFIFWFGMFLMRDEADNHAPFHMCD